MDVSDPEDYPIYVPNWEDYPALTLDEVFAYQDFVEDLLKAAAELDDADN